MESRNELNMKALNMLEKYIMNWCVVLDSYSIIESCHSLFWQHVIPLLHTYQKVIYVPGKCINELIHLCRNTDNLILASYAEDSLNQLKMLVDAHYIEIVSNQTQSFLDQKGLSYFGQRNDHLLLVTQDKKMAFNVKYVSEAKKMGIKDFRAVQIDEDGYLSSYSMDAQTSAKQAKTKKESSRVIDQNEIFAVKTNVIGMADSVLSVNKIPAESEMVYANGKAVKLVKKLAEGGEGMIYVTDTPFVAKIYKRDTNTIRKYAKIQRMLKHHVQCEGICFPTAALYNANEEFVGYLMNKAKGTELQRSIFLKPLFQKKFPNWKKIDTVQLCITILKKIQYLHDRNIIMGDINPFNILVVSQNEVYFVDTDSYQIEDLPCPVGTTLFTAPEIQGKKYAEFLRTFGNEYFAIATLLFMIMVPGKPPYAQQEGQGLAANIINMDFSYPFGDNSNKKTPEGPWRFIWSHLTYEVKEAFYNTFRKGGQYATESTRLTVDDWLKIFNKYYRLLNDGILAKNDEMSEYLFPTRFKKNTSDGNNYIRCKLCGHEFPENKCTNGYCEPCLRQGKTYKCVKCGKLIFYSNREKLIEGRREYDICYDCNKEGQKAHSKLVCVDCGNTFIITNSEYEFYKQKGLNTPCRCKSCRQKRKEGGNSRRRPQRPQFNW